MPLRKWFRFTMSIDVDYLLLNDQIKLGYAHETDAGIDLASTENVTLAPFERATISCGFSIAIPQGYAGLVIPRSGLASRFGISIVNSPGLIDSGYRGEIKVVLINLDPNHSFEVHTQDRIAQLVIIALPNIDLKPCDTLPQSDRGEAGFGSTGIS